MMQRRLGEKKSSSRPWWKRMVVININDLQEAITHNAIRCQFSADLELTFLLVVINLIAQLFHAVFKGGYGIRNIVGLQCRKRLFHAG